VTPGLSSFGIKDHTTRGQGAAGISTWRKSTIFLSHLLTYYYSNSLFLEETDGTEDTALSASASHRPYHSDTTFEPFLDANNFVQ
jgi:hypothetical protein